MSEPAAEAEPTDVLDSAEAGAKVVRGGAVRIAGFVSATLVTIVGAALVTRHLGPGEYGRFQTVVALVTIVLAITDLGISALGIREYSQRTGRDRDAFMGVLLGLRLTLTFVGMGGAALAAVALGYDGTLILGTAIMGVGVLLVSLESTLTIPIFADLRMGTATVIDMGRQTLTTIGYVALVAAGASLTPFFAVTGVAQLLVLAGTVGIVRRQISLRPTFAPRAWLALVRPTISFGLATAAGQIYVYTALILTGLVTSERETGLFAASFRVYIIVAAVPGLLATSAFPVLSRAARDDRARMTYATQRLFEGTALLGGAALIACVVGAPAIIEVVAGPKYDGAIDVLRVHGVALAMTFVLVTWSFALLALHRQRAMALSNLFSLVVSATTVLALGSTHGARGAAWGTVLGELALAVGYVVSLRRATPPLRLRFDRAGRAVPALAVGIAVGVLPGWPAVPGAVAGEIAYCVLVLALGAVPGEIIEQIPVPATWRRGRRSPSG